jgi:general L-amino acid transport system permease protein
MSSAELRGRFRPWEDGRVRAAAAQGLVVLALGTLAWLMVANVLDNLARLGLNAGFQFLWRPAGFGITQTLIPYSEASSYGRAFLVALANTLALSAVAIAIATVLGFVVGLARLSGNPVIAGLALVYVDALRNIPLLLQIFFWYFAVLRPLPSPRQSIVFGGVAFLSNRGLVLPAPLLGPGVELVVLAAGAGVAAAIGLAVWARRRQRATGRRPAVLAAGTAALLGLPLLAAAGTGFSIHWDVPRLVGFNFQGGIAVIPEAVAMLVALSVYAAAFIAEIVRAGVLAVPHGQVEAARALGLTQGPIYRLVVVPQALRVIVPPLTSQYLNLVKNSSLAAAIAYPDLMLVFAGTVLNQTGQAIEVMTLTMGTYLAISLLIALLMNWYNRRVALAER